MKKVVDINGAKRGEILVKGSGLHIILNTDSKVPENLYIDVLDSINLGKEILKYFGTNVTIVGKIE